MVFFNRWVVAILTLPYLTIYYFNLSGLQPIVRMWQYGIVIVAIAVLFKNLKTYNLLLILYSVIVMVASLYNHNLTPQALFSTVTLLGFCIYFNTAFKLQRAEVIKGLYYLLATVILLNFLSMLKGGLAIGENYDVIYFLGNKNAISLIAIPAIAIAYLYRKEFKNDKNKWTTLVILLSIVSCYISKSGTGIVASLLGVAYFITPKKKLPSMYVYLAVFLASFFGLVVYRLHDRWLGDFIINVLHKNTTLTGRTYVWDYVFQLMPQSWVFGYGRGNHLILENFQRIFNETHNGILEILMYCGVFGLIFFTVLMLKPMRKLQHFRESSYSRVISFFIFTFLMVSLSESVFNKPMFWILILLAYRIDIFVEEQKVEIQEETVLKKSA